MSQADPRRLRADANNLARPFNVVLVEPEIPPNTGNIARLCVATASPLHLVGRLGFSIDAHAVRRAGVDYWEHVQLQTHTDLPTATKELQSQGSRRRWLLSGRSQHSYLDVAFEPGDMLVFGKESCGLPEALLEAYPQEAIGIPTLGPVRSLNLANSVSIVLFEALRQSGALNSCAFR